MEIKKRKLSRFFDEEEDSLRAPSLVPMDCLLLIFSYLRSEDLVNLRSVCKEFEIAFSNTLLSYPYLTLFKIFRKIGDNYGNTKDLDSKSSPSRNIKTVNRLEEVGKSFLELSKTFKYVTTMENLITTNTKYERNKKDFFHRLVSKITSAVITKESYKYDGHINDIFSSEPTKNEKNEITIEFGDSCTLQFIYELEKKEEMTGVILTFPSKKNTRFLDLYPRLFHDIMKKHSSFSEVVEEEPSFNNEGERIQIGVKMKDFFGAAARIQTRKLISKELEKKIRKSEHESESWFDQKNERDWCFERELSRLVQFERRVYPPQRKTKKNETISKRNDDEINEIFQNEVMLLFYNILFFGSKYGGFANRFYENQKFDVFRNFFLTLHQFEKIPSNDAQDHVYNYNDIDEMYQDVFESFDRMLLSPPSPEIDHVDDAIIPPEPPENILHEILRNSFPE